MKRKMLFMVAAVALLMAACSTETKVLPKKPVITNQLSLQSNQYPQGEDAYPLTVTATTKDKKAKLSYQWYVNTENSAKKGAKIAGATEVEYTPSTEAIGEFYYYVEVVSTLNKEKAKATSDVAAITIVDPKEIPQIGTSNGKEGEVEQGEDILLNIKLPESIEELLASEEGEDLEVLYQWYDNGDRNSNVGGTAIPTATESSYMPDKTEAGTTFYYAVITVKNKVTGEVVKTLTTSPQKVTVIVNTTIIDPTKENARLPVIEDHPAASPPYYVGITAAPLTVTARVSDGGILSYQWYRNPPEVDEDNYPIGAGERITGATRTSYIPPTNAEGTTSYYVVVTNEIEDNQDGGQKTATRTSKVAEVEVVKGRDAQTPNITTQPISATYSLMGSPTALKVVAPVTDGGDVSYQWYSNDEFSNEGGDPIEGATSQTYMPSTARNGAYYYYVVVTNRIPDTDPPDGGKKTASVKSNAVYVAVGITVITLNVPSLNKAYDGTTAVTATWTTFTFTPSVTLANATVHKGTAVFAQADAGSNIPIILEGWYLEGEGKENYLMLMPTNPRATITKATGSTVTTNPSVKGVPTGNTIEVNVVELTNPEWGQTVEYARSTTSNGSNLSAWQASPILTGLSCLTNYYIYARSKETANYAAGTYRVSSVIATGQPVVVFEVNGGDPYPFSTVNKGVALPKPTDVPTKAGHTFDYWYTTAALTTPYDFTLVVNDNLYLYAKWVSNNLIAEMSSKDMVLVKGGTYKMGSPTSETNRLSSYRIEEQHDVLLGGFFMGRYEVTQEKWQAVMGSNPSNNKTGTEVGTPEKLPVENVSWYEALVFCNKLSMNEDLTPVYTILGSTNPNNWGAVPVIDSTTWNAVTVDASANGYRLPTEAEWEYACRAGTTTAFHTGSTANTDTGWSGDYTSTTHRVGLKTVNAWGLYDMHGNVAEWCWDYFGYVPNPAPAVSVNPVTTKADQSAYSTLSRLSDATVTATTLNWPRLRCRANDGTNLYWTQFSGESSYNMSGLVPTETELQAILDTYAGKGRPTPASSYLKLLENRSSKLATYDCWSYATGSWVNTVKDYNRGYYYDRWTSTTASVAGGRVARGGAYNLINRFLRSASRTNTAQFSNVVAELPTSYYSNTNDYPRTYGQCTFMSYTKYVNVGLRVVKGW